VQDQAGGPIGARRREHRRQGSGVGHAEEHDPLGPDGVQHRGQIVDQILQWREVIGRDAVGDTGPTLIDHDQS
jgi:hypothetical protein